MKDLLTQIANINSYSYNVEGLSKVKELLKSWYQNFENNCPKLKLKYEEFDLKPQKFISRSGQIEEKQLGKALLISKEIDPNLPSILLMGHMDTVFPESLGFNECKDLGNGIMNGPGVSDLKGGLVVILKALEKFENSELADKLNWQVFFNPDEEVGSPGSSKIFPMLAEKNKWGLIYEPSLPDGSFTYRRKGAANYQLAIHGKASHVGRAFDEGTSAILIAAEFINQAQALNENPNIIINFGKIEGGGPLNIVPELAILGINIRIEENTDEKLVLKKLNQIIDELQDKYSDAKFLLQGKFNRKPKVPNTELDLLYEVLEDCTKELNLDFKKRNTGGCCDGNNLWEYGLPNIDTLGVRGKDIHSTEEIIYLDSLEERTELSFLLLKRLALL
ncbi:MAG: hydrolase [Candidatus Caenarcaniphilales bacterium]|nr:hydrolase [Candidatus Caenarcaniphilales bacterium]